MRVTVEEVLKQERTLEEQGRAAVAGALLESPHPKVVDTDAEEAWDAEFKRRVQDLVSAAGTI